MGKDSEISWTHHTFNIVWGCTKVSEACKHCYAETFSKRVGLKVWGQDADRRILSDSYWREPLKWEAAAAACGVRQRVFCSSMADVFEDHPIVESQRVRLWPLVDATPHLDWLLLTKRPENIERMMTKPRANVWLGTTCETQARYDERIGHIARAGAKLGAVTFLSLEPLLGPIRLGLLGTAPKDWDLGYRALHELISWVIVGGESGPHARPMHPEWARSLREECDDVDVPYHFKQWGDLAPVGHKDDSNQPKLGANERWVNREGGHGFHGDDVYRFRRLGKKKAGRLLDGEMHDAFPENA